MLFLDPSKLFKKRTFRAKGPKYEPSGAKPTPGNPDPRSKRLAFFGPLKTPQKPYFQSQKAEKASENELQPNISIKRKTSLLDLGSGFPGVGFAPEGSYVGPLALKVRFLTSFEGSKKRKPFRPRIWVSRGQFCPRGFVFRPFGSESTFFDEF